MSEQSEFEKWLKWEAKIHSNLSLATGIELGARAARDWILNKAKELIKSDYTQNRDYIDPSELEEACK